MTEHNHKEYTAEDFDRYYSGKMPEAEMHALEKSALEDPFLADALEGYNYTKTPVTDIAELKERLFKKKKKNQVFFLQNKVWFKVAASITLFAGISYMIYQLNSKKSFLTNNETKQIAKAKDSTITPRSETITRNETALSAKISEPKNQQTLSNKNEYHEVHILKKIQADSTKTTAYNLSKSKDNNPFESEAHMLQGRVVNTEGNAVAMATIRDNKKQIVTVTDSAGRFKLNAKDSSATATIAAVGYETKQSKLATNADQTVVMTPAKQGLQEVVVTGLGVSKRKNVTGELAGTVAGVSVNDSTYAPVGGWKKFEQYLSNNISIPVDEDGEQYKGKVVISFHVNKKGNPQKIKIEQSLCDECDKEAIRLLQSGPKWKYVEGKKYVIDVRF